MTALRLTRGSPGIQTPSGRLRRTGSSPLRAGGGPPPPTLLIPNEDLVPLPAAVPMPPELIADHWQFEIATTYDSTTLPNLAGLTNLFGVNDEQALVFQVAGPVLRLDLYAGASQQVGNFDWVGPVRIRISVDVPGGIISVETLVGTVNYTGGWTSTTATTATKTLTPWVWATGTANFGGFLGLFVFDGVIENVMLA